LPLVGAVGIAKYRLRAVLAEDGLPATNDFVERVIPCRRNEAPLALGTRAAQGGRHALRRVHHLMVVVDLGARKAGSEGVIGIALDPHDAPILDVGEERALVGAL